MDLKLSRRNLLALAGTAGTIGAFGLMTPTAAFADEVIGTSGPHVNEDYISAQPPKDATQSYSPSTFDAWVANTENRYIDMDGAFGAQCWDLWESYCRTVIGCSNISTRYGAHPGFAIGIWDGFDYNGASRYFTKISASSTPRKGDVAFWQYGQTYTPYSHVAMVVSDAGSSLYCFSQNSTAARSDNPYPNQSTGPSVKHYITKQGLAGYLRPIGSSAPAIGSLADLVAVDSSGILWNYPASGAGSFGSRVQIGTGWAGMVAGWTVDWTGNGVIDIVAQWNDGGLRLYRGQSDGTFAAHLTIGTGWQGFQAAPSRFVTSDTFPGMLAKDPAGVLWYYPNPSGGYFTAGKTQIGQDWGALDILSMDFNGDGNQDVLGINASHALKLYKGNGAGGWIDASGSQVGTGWDFISVAPTAGFTGNGTRGLYAQAGDGVLYYYPVTGSGVFGTRSVVGQGWNGYKILNGQRLR